MGSVCVIASQFLWTSKSVDRLYTNKIQVANPLSFSCYRAHIITKRQTYYEGNNNNLRTVDATSVSRSNGVMSAHHSRTVFHEFESDSHGDFAPAFSSTTTTSRPSVVEPTDTFNLGFESLKVVRFEREVGEDGWSVIVESLHCCPGHSRFVPAARPEKERKTRKASKRVNSKQLVVTIQARTRAGNNITRRYT